MTTASSVCRGIVLTSSRLKSASSAAIWSGCIGLVEHWQVGAIMVLWEVSGTDHQSSYQVSQTHFSFWLVLVTSGPV